MIITLDNLSAGLPWFREKWGKEFLNADYYEIYEVRSAGVTDQWWTSTVDRLIKWKAHRARRPPNTKEAIFAGGVRRLSAIAAQFTRILEISTTEPSITDLDWEDVAPLFALAAELKPGSPVLPSKMCHFLLPKLFTVMDNEGTGVFDYEFYWRGMKDEWHRFENKEEAVRILAEAVESDRPLHPRYPLETKIMELSHIGYHNKRTDP